MKGSPYRVLDRSAADAAVLLARACDHSLTGRADERDPTCAACILLDEARAALAVQRNVTKVVDGYVETVVTLLLRVWEAGRDREDEPWPALCEVTFACGEELEGFLERTDDDPPDAQC